MLMMIRIIRISTFWALTNLCRHLSVGIRLTAQRLSSGSQMGQHFGPVARAARWAWDVCFSEHSAQWRFSGGNLIMSTLGQFVFHSTVSQFRGPGSKTRKGGKNEIDYKSKILFTSFLWVLVDDERNSPRTGGNCGEKCSRPQQLCKFAFHNNKNLLQGQSALGCSFFLKFLSYSFFSLFFSFFLSFFFFKGRGLGGGRWTQRVLLSLRIWNCMNDRGNIICLCNISPAWSLRFCQCLTSDLKIPKYCFISLRPATCPLQLSSSSSVSPSQSCFPFVPSFTCF